MREQGQDRLKRGYGACGVSGEVEDQSVSDGAADPPAKRGEGGLPEAGEAHAFREAVDEALADDARGLGGDIAGGEAGAAGGNDQGCGGGMATKRVDNPIQFIGNRFHCRGYDPGGFETCADGGSREVLLTAVEAAITDGEDGGASTGGEGLIHGSSLRGRVRIGRPGELHPAYWTAGMRR